MAKDILSDFLSKTTAQKGDKQIKEYVKRHEQETKEQHERTKNQLKKLFSESILVLKIRGIRRETPSKLEISDKPMGFMIYPDGSLGDWGPDENSMYDSYFKNMKKERIFKEVRYENEEIGVK